jgi:hypothetical protein
MSIERQVELADTIFEGRLVSASDRRLIFDVRVVYKGHPETETAVRMERRSVVLGRRDVGSTFLVMARERPGGLVFIPCGNSGRLAEVSEARTYIARRFRGRTLSE